LFEGRGAVGRFRECLDNAGFTLDGLTERLGSQAFANVAGREFAPLVRATREGDRLDTTANEGRTCPYQTLTWRLSAKRVARPRPRWSTEEEPGARAGATFQRNR
jgi:hypothetical protein